MKVAKLTKLDHWLLILEKAFLDMYEVALLTASMETW